MLDSSTGREIPQIRAPRSIWRATLTARGQTSKGEDDVQTARQTAVEAAAVEIYKYLGTPITAQWQKGMEPARQKNEEGCDAANENGGRAHAIKCGRDSTSDERRDGRGVFRVWYCRAALLHRDHRVGDLRGEKERKQTTKGGMGGEKERKKTDNPREGWEDGTPPPHRDFKERGVMR